MHFDVVDSRNYGEFLILSPNRSLGFTVSVEVSSKTSLAEAWLIFNLFGDVFYFVLGYSEAKGKQAFKFFRRVCHGLEKRQIHSGTYK